MIKYAMDFRRQILHGENYNTIALVFGAPNSIKIIEAGEPVFWGESYLSAAIKNCRSKV